MFGTSGGERSLRMKARLILRHTRYDDETRVKPFHSAPDKNLPFCRSYIATLYASRVCDRGGKKSRSVSLSMFLFIFFCFSFSSSIPLPLLIHPHRGPHSRIGGGSTCRECPANRAIIRETHLGARQTRLNLFLVDPMPTRQPLLVLVSLRC